jgi:hypothetical protein
MSRGAPESRWITAHLVAGEDDRESRRLLGAHDVVKPRQLDAEDVAIEEQECAQGLVLSGGGHATLDGE